VSKSAFIDDRTLDTEDVKQLEAAISEVVKMDNLMGHTTNVDKSKVLATTRRTRRQAGQMAIGGLKLNLVHDFKLLGHRCVAAHRFIIQDADEAAIEARIRVKRTATLPLDYSNKLKVLKTSPIKVFTAATQWGRAKMSNIHSLTSEILQVLWGKTRKARAKEVVFGLLHDATDFHPRSAMIWNTITNARRMMKKDDSILQHAKLICQIREDRAKKDQQEKVLPKTRLCTKTTEAEVVKKNRERDEIQVTQCGYAKAEPKRATGCTSHTGTAKAEPNRLEIPEASSNNTNMQAMQGQTRDLFAPYYHPEAASSDGKERENW
jgi:hypothetical protein